MSTVRSASTQRPPALVLASPPSEKQVSKSQKDAHSPNGSKLNRRSPLSPGDGQFERMTKMKLTIESCKQRIENGDYMTEKQRLADLERLSNYRGQLALMSLCDDMYTEARSIVDEAIKINFNH
jgi:hypothetical protein